MPGAEAALLAVLLIGCALRTTSNVEAARARALSEADALWAARAEGDNLTQAVGLWMELLAADPDDPAALARLARAEWTVGQLDPDGGLRRFESGHDYGARCLLGWPAFAANLDAARYRMTAEAVAELPGSAAPCALWTAVGGLTLAGARGPGAALDLTDVALLLDRLRALGPEAVGLDPGFLAWAEARYLVLSVAPGPPPPEARARFAEAIAADPEVGLFRRDLAAAFPDARGVAFDGFGAAAPNGWARENAVWVGGGG